MSDSNENQQQLSAKKQALLERRRKAKLKSSNVSATTVTISKKPSDAPPLVSFGQERLWYLQQLNPKDTAYHMAHVVRIRGPLNYDALNDAKRLLVERHDILRTTFIQQDDNLIQQVHGVTGDPIDIEYFVLEQGALVEQIKTYINQPFDLEQGPLFRMGLIHESDDTYICMIVMHHIISDEWSMNIIWQELSTIYQGITDSQTVDLPSTSIKYVDFAWWQHQQMQQGFYNSQLQYWREQLKGDLPMLQLPTDFLRPPVKQYRGAFITRVFSESLSASLISLAKASNTTLFVILLAAFQAFLHRYTGQTDILVGTPTTNRENQQNEHLIGFFLNTIVHRADFSNGQSFEALLRKTRKHSLDALVNQNLPFDYLVKDLNPGRDPSYTPIFQVMFVYQDAEPYQVKIPELEFEPITIDAGISKFDLTLFVKFKNAKIEVSLEYDKSLFDPQTAERILTHYEAFLESIVEEPAKDIAELNLLPTSEKNIILDDWVQTQLASQDNRCIHELIAQHSPDSIAVRFGDASLTYRELNQRANQVAHYLLEQGTDTGTFIGLCVERSIDMVVGILGILKAGCAYIPIDPAYPKERIKYLLTDADISLVLTQDALLSRLGDVDVRYVCLNQLTLFDTLPTTVPDVSISPDSIAYMIYTSGSTGKPKGVKVSHRNLVHSTTVRFDYYPHPARSFLLLSSFAFDSSIAGIFWTLCQGGALCLPLQGAERDVIQIAQLLEKYQVTHTLLLPALYQILLEYASPPQLASLNTVIVAGEACPKLLPKMHYEMVPNAILHNEYGPTEATVWSTVWQIPPDPLKILIGKPIQNAQVYILDPNLSLVAIGVVGELFIGGAGVTQGYHNRPDLTQERFITNPFGKGKLYRTGDLARYQNDGNIEFLGRVDNQVKINGYRIELREIESVLQSHPLVDDATILLWDNQKTLSEEDYDVEMLVSLIESHPNGLQILEEIENLSEKETRRLLSAI